MNSAQQQYEYCAINAETKYQMCLNDADNRFQQCEGQCDGGSGHQACVNSCYYAQQGDYFQCYYYYTYGDLAACEQQQYNANSFCEEGLTHCQINCPSS
jgi:hypothetical protein